VVDRRLRHFGAKRTHIQELPFSLALAACLSLLVAAIEGDGERSPLLVKALAEAGPCVAR
jgi:hypothetical protein